MARSNFRIEQGIEILTPNGTTGTWLLQAAGAPLGTSGATDSAPIGSVYMKNDGSGELYRKKTSTSSASDWVRFVDESIYTAMGISFGDTDMGTYTGNIITDNVDQAQVNQELETAIEAISGGSTETTNVPAGTPTTVSTCLVDACNGVEWEVCAYEQGSEATKEFFKLASLHNGTSTADATAFDEAVHTKLKLADISGLTFTSKLAGTGAAQTLGLEISATAAITVKVRRTDIP